MQQMLHKPTRRDYPRVEYGHDRSILEVMTSKRIERFRAKIDTSAGRFACHPWQGGCNGGGYGLVQGCDDYVGFSFLAHRVAWALAHRREPGDLLVWPRCRNRLCCNERHLVAGTDRAHWLGMIEDGGRAPAAIGDHARGKFGPDANAADYTAEDREKARRLRYVHHLPMAVIAAIIGCHRGTLTRWFADIER